MQTKCHDSEDALAWHRRCEVGLVQDVRRLGLLLYLALLAAVGISGAAPSALAFGGGPSADEAHDIAMAAYVYGYPLVTMELTRRVRTNVAAPEGQRAPMGQLARMRTYPTSADRAVTAPSADTLSTTAWVDLTEEPYVLSLPDMQGRYSLFPMLDAWTNVFQDPGTRTTGTGPQTYVLTGPGWEGGPLPPGATHVIAPTNLVWILGSILSNGTPSDLDAVHALQDQVTLVPLSAYGKPYAPPAGTVDAELDGRTPVRTQVDALDAATFFGTMTALMVRNPPSKDDRPMLDRMAKIGIKAGKPLDSGKLSPDVVAAIERAPGDARERLKTEGRAAPMKEGGWLVLLRTGRYGTEYTLRALVTAVGLGANLPEDAVYPVAVDDVGGQRLDGSKKYTLRLEKGQLPPVRGFWSLTLYDDQMFFAPNVLGRYALGQRDRFVPNPDGSVDLLVQHDSPGADREANWLPAPAGRFVLLLRMYWPNERAPTILGGTWRPPAVVRAPSR